MKTAERKMRPLIRYHGGKWMLAPWIISHFPSHRIYVEPFGGGGSVLLRKPRCYSEIYNDIDAEIVNLFLIVRDSGEELRKKLSLTPFARDEFEAAYLPTEDPLELARRTVVRAFQGFGTNAHSQITGFRPGSHRAGTTPAHDWMHFPDALPAIIERLRGVVIENRDAIGCIRQHDGHDTLFYVDPPYVHDTRGKTRYRYEMNEEEHRELASVLHEVKGAVVVSGYDSPLYQSLYNDFHKVERQAFADGARRRVECLWIKAEQAQLTLKLEA